MTKRKDSSITVHEALVRAWQRRKDYKGYDRSRGSAFNSWRAIINTKKGARAGYPAEWRKFENFMQDVEGEWAKGKICCRKDSTKPFAKGNCFWADKGTENMAHLSVLTYNGKTQTLVEWAAELGVNYSGVRQRFFRGKNYTPEEILFGKTYRPRQWGELEEENRRIVHILCQYKHNDRRKGLTCDIDKEFTMNLCRQPCVYCGDTFRVGLDRIDNSKGHTKDNVVPCCYECNCARNDRFTHEEMLEIGKAIRSVKCKRLKEKH